MLEKIVSRKAVNILNIAKSNRIKDEYTVRLDADATQIHPGLVSRNNNGTFTVTVGANFVNSFANSHQLYNKNEKVMPSLACVYMKCADATDIPSQAIIEVHERIVGEYLEDADGNVLKNGRGQDIRFAGTSDVTELGATYYVARLVEINPSGTFIRKANAWAEKVAMEQMDEENHAPALQPRPVRDVEAIFAQFEQPKSEGETPAEEPEEKPTKAKAKAKPAVDAES